MAEKPNNLLEWMLMMASAKLPTKQEFGDAMHGSRLSEAEKIELARKVMLAGGYACLGN